MSTSKNMMKWIHVAIVLFLMIGFGCLPPIEPITPYGMKVLGIFLGLVYGWGFCDLIWPSILSIAMLALVGYNTLPNIIMDGFGSTTTWAVVMVFIIAQALNEARVSQYLAVKILNNKLFFGRPWVLSFGIIIAAFLLSALAANPFAAMIVIWSIVYDLSLLVGYQKKDIWPSMMILGITLAAIVGMGAFPHGAIPLIIFGAYLKMGGAAISYFTYILLCWSLLFLIVVAYLIVCKFILKVDLSKLKAVDESAFEGKINKLTAHQTGILVLFIIMIFAFLASNMLPKTIPGVELLSALGIHGIAGIFCALGVVIHIEGKPLIDFQKAASDGITWSAIMIIAAALPIATALVAPATGIQTFVGGVLGSIFIGKPAVIFVAMVLFLSLFTTNFANNMITSLIFMTVSVGIAMQLGVNVTALVALIVIIVHVAILTPAACPFAAMLFANEEWISAKFIYKHASIILVITTIIFCTYGYGVACLLF